MEMQSINKIFSPKTNQYSPLKCGQFVYNYHHNVSA